ncbi:MAG TPA: hemolysin family protein [Bacteroidia bacterium]|jgi:CBS domain containing-hemolysin-like protein
MNNPWLIVVLSLVGSAFFSGMEIAFLTSNKLRIELESKQGSISARIFSYFIKRQADFIAAMLVGNCISLVVFGLFMSEILTPPIRQFIHSEALVLIIQTTISTLFILITAEYLPKNLFRKNPNGVLNFFSFPVFILYFILYPVVFITITIADFLLRVLFRVKKEEGVVAYGRIDLDNLVRESTTRISERQELEHEVQIFKNALDFSEVKARQCMIPRTEIVAIDVNAPIDELRKRFVETRLSKILVYENSIDNIIGYTHSYELFKRPTGIRSVLLPVLIVPESMAASEVLTLFIQQRKSISLVVDEFGGTSGMLTIEDVVEEIFGEIEDEHDKEELVEKRISANEFIFSARIEIDHINKKYNLNLPIAEGYETLGGLVLHNYGSIPKPDEVIRIDRFVFRIISVSNTRIDQVNLKVEEA